MPLLFNSPESKEYRRKLRGRPTRAEALLWWHLRNRKFLGYKFRRQHGIGLYIVDFFCPKLQLAIEVDGDTHFQEGGLTPYDRQREAWLIEQRLWVIRFTDREVLQDTAGVLDRLKAVVDSINQNHP